MKKHPKPSRSNTISLEAAHRLAQTQACTLLEVEINALKKGIWPLRYVRHSSLVTPAEQIKFLSSTVLVAGCGGLGGYAAMFLARLGVGTLLLVDHDTFDETNMNRQLFCTAGTIGSLKAEVTARQISGINPATDAKAINSKIEETGEFLNSAHAVLDCLDNVSSRLSLAQMCRKNGVPLIHGAVQGVYCEIAVEKPGTSRIMELLYPHQEKQDGASQTLPFSVGAVAALQCAEAWKLLTGRESCLNGGWVFWDISAFEFEKPKK